MLERRVCGKFFKADVRVHAGLVTLGQAFDQSYGALVATRFLVGIFDAGMIPG